MQEEEEEEEEGGMKGMLAICSPLTEYNRRKIEGLTERGPD